MNLFAVAQNVTQFSAIGALAALAMFLSKRLLKLDGTSIRVIDDQCAKELAACRAQIADLRVEVAVLKGQVAQHLARINPTTRGEQS